MYSFQKHNKKPKQSGLSHIMFWNELVLLPFDLPPLFWCALNSIMHRVYSLMLVVHIQVFFIFSVLCSGYFSINDEIFFVQPLFDNNKTVVYQLVSVKHSFTAHMWKLLLVFIGLSLIIFRGWLILFIRLVILWKINSTVVSLNI